MRKKILVMTAVEAERDAILRGLNGDDRCEVALAGVGPAAAAARTAAVLARGGDYSLVVSAGIGGGFAGVAAVGDIVVASEIVAADLGAETAEGGFVSVDELGFGSSRVVVDAALSERLAGALTAAGLAVRRGAVVTVSTATGTAGTAAARFARVAGAAAEGMEGYGVAAAAEDAGLPVLELRAISNAVGPRDRSTWRIGEALALLEKAGSILPEVLAK